MSHLALNTTDILSVSIKPIRSYQYYFSIRIPVLIELIHDCSGSINCAYFVYILGSNYKCIKAEKSIENGHVLVVYSVSSKCMPSGAPANPVMICKCVTLTAEGARSLKCISKCETSLHFFHLSGCTLQHHHYVNVNPSNLPPLCNSIYLWSKSLWDVTKALKKGISKIWKRIKDLYKKYIWGKYRKYMGKRIGKVWEKYRKYMGKV